MTRSRSSSSSTPSRPSPHDQQQAWAAALVLIVGVLLAQQHRAYAVRPRHAPRACGNDYSRESARAEENPERVMDTTEPASDVTSARRDHRRRGLVFELDDVTVATARRLAIDDVNMDVARKQVTAFIGPSGCGKTTLLRSLNRMNDLDPRRDDRRR